MQLFNLLSSFATQYTNKYISRAKSLTPNMPPGLNRELLPPNAATPARAGIADNTANADAYLPSEMSSNDISSPLYDRPEVSIDEPNLADTENPDTVDISSLENDENSDIAPITDTPTRITRQAELGYNLTLQFDLASFTQTIERMADGEISEIDQLAMATFGLSTDFVLKGSEVIEIETAEAVDKNFHVRSLQSFNGRQASKFSAQSRDFQASSFMRESTDMRRKIDIKFKDNARRAVNKFSLRYSSDSQFSFKFAERLQVQTEQVGDQSPESVGSYLDSAGDVAGAGTNEMMVAFFDAVEGYLSANKDQTMASVTAFFGEAADALGLSGTDLAQFAENNLTDTIDSFFSKVSSAVDTLRSQYVGETPAEAPQPTVPEIPAEYGSTEITTDQYIANDPKFEDNLAQAVA